MYDLVLKGGTVVDPSVGLHGVHDIAVQNGLIAHIAPRSLATRLPVSWRWRGRSLHRA